MFAIGTVVYEPSRALLARVDMLNAMGFTLYIYDNSPESPLTRNHVRGMSNVQYFTSGKNLGLGVGLSTICAQAYYSEFEELLFFDQDTIFGESTIGYIGEVIRELGRGICDYAVIAFEGGKASVADSDARRIVAVPLAISSGSLFVLQNLKMMGWHNERYFVDGVDYELCLRARISKLKVGKCRGAPGFDHASEQPDVAVALFGRKIVLRRYSLARIHDTTRAYLRLVGESTFAGQFAFAAVIFRLYCAYVAYQILARMVLQ